MQLRRAWKDRKKSKGGDPMPNILENVEHIRELYYATLPFPARSMSKLWVNRNGDDVSEEEDAGDDEGGDEDEDEDD